MSRIPRVFISSTMKDLPNERYEVFERLKSFNLEPVMAEELPTSSGGIWPTIKKEIGQCDIFILISGARYGWVPDEGPEAERELSVTHLELEEARSLGLPILVFQQRPPEDMNRETEDAKRWAKFRESFKNWKDGYFVAKEFWLARELANQAGAAVMNLLFDNFWQQKERKREEERHELETLREQVRLGETSPAASSESDLPPDLVDAVASRRAVLFAGAGFSLSAGFPSAQLFAERLKQIVRESAPDYNPDSWSGTPAAVSADFEAALGRQPLEAAAAELTLLPNVLPTYAHVMAARLFDYIITTNFDTLFERAGARTVISQEPSDTQLPAEAVIKLHGSADVPHSLVLVERDVLTLDTRLPKLWGVVLNLLRTRPVLVVGSSLRDPSIIRLFTEAGEKASGYFVAPAISKTAEARLKAWNLACIETDADTFFGALNRALPR